jgi:hypothetical protein
MRFEFSPTPEDYQRVMRIFYLSDLRLWIIMGLFGLPQLCCGAYALLQDAFSNKLLPIISLLLFPAFILYLLVFMPWNFKQRVMNDKRLQAKTTWQVSEEKITVKNEYSESTNDWEAYQRVIESRDYYLLFYKTNRSKFQILPKRAFVSVEKEAAFQKMVASKVVKYRVLRYL